MQFIYLDRSIWKCQPWSYHIFHLSLMAQIASLEAFWNLFRACFHKKGSEKKEGREEVREENSV